MVVVWCSCADFVEPDSFTNPPPRKIGSLEDNTTYMYFPCEQLLR